MNAMSSRDRFLAHMSFEPVDRPPLREWGPWTQTRQRWAAEGMPESGPPQFAECDAWHDMGIDFGPWPRYDESVVAEDEDSVTHYTHKGVLVRERRERELSMPAFLQYPVTDRASWEAYRERYDPTSPQRYSADFAARARQAREQGCLVQLSGGRETSFFGHLREIMGAEEAMIILHDDPQLVHEIMDFLADFMVGIYEEALAQFVPDLAYLWEDMCYHTASLISPAMFREFLLPGYQKVCGALKGLGVAFIAVDSDGYTGELNPLWLEGGVDIIYPFEVAAHNDVVELRAQYGKRLGMMGGLDKRVLAAGPEAIDAELERKLPVALAGGYIPTIDHSLPPDIPYANFCYYWERKKALLGIGTPAGRS